LAEVGGLPSTKLRPPKSRENHSNAVFPFYWISSSPISVPGHRRAISPQKLSVHSFGPYIKTKMLFR